MNEEKLLKFERKIRDDIKREVGKELYNLKYRLRKNEITREEFETDARMLLELKRKLMEKTAGK